MSLGHSPLAKPGGHIARRSLAIALPIRPKTGSAEGAGVSRIGSVNAGMPMLPRRHAAESRAARPQAEGNFHG